MHPVIPTSPFERDAISSIVMGAPFTCARETSQTRFL